MNISYPLSEKSIKRVFRLLNGLMEGLLLRDEVLLGIGILGFLFIMSAYLAYLQPQRYPTYQHGPVLVMGVALLGTGAIGLYLKHKRAKVAPPLSLGSTLPEDANLTRRPNESTLIENKQKEQCPVPESTRIKLAELSNPMLDAAISSLSNALELFQQEDERHRQAALVQMDQAVEYILKAFLFQIDSKEFIRKDLENMLYEKALERVEQEGTAISEKDLLRKAHSARNEAQHRGTVASISWSRFLMKNVYEFMRRFSSENFGLDIDNVIPMDLKLGFYKEPSRPEIRKRSFQS